jgi:hypothetical protein
MKASELVQTLKDIIAERGDLPVTIVCGAPHEYSLLSAGFAQEGALPNIADVQKQEDLPDRIVLEARDSIS